MAWRYNNIVSKDWIIYIVYGLYAAQRYNHLSNFISRAETINPNIKYHLQSMVTAIEYKPLSVNERKNLIRDFLI
jgi:hypothetical protein